MSWGTGYARVPYSQEDEEDAEQNARLRGSFQALMLRRLAQNKTFDDFEAASFIIARIHLLLPTCRCLSYKVHVALLKGLQRRGNRVLPSF